MCNVKNEQRIVIKFLVKSGEKSAEIFRKLQHVFNIDCLSKPRVYEWAKRFASGRESTQDDARSGAPKIVHTRQNVERLRVLVRTNRRLTIRMMSDELCINKETIRQMLHDDLLMRKLCAKLVPKVLTAEQKELRRSICEDFLERIQSEGRDWMNSIITADESWVYQYDPETRRQSKQWVEERGERPTKAQMSRSQIKTMLICFFDKTGIVHREFIPQGQTVTSVFYIEVLKRLCQRVSRVRPELAKNGWVLHHDNAPAHTSLKVQQFLTSRNITTLSHPPYSPDLAPLDFWLFPKLKKPMKGHRYEDLEDIKRTVTSVLKNLTSGDFQECFQKWEKCWTKCIRLGGEYCEGMGA